MPPPPSRPRGHDSPRGHHSPYGLAATVRPDPEVTPGWEPEVPTEVIPEVIPC